MTHDVAGFYASLGVELPDRGGAERPVRCFANPDGHQHDDRNPSCSVNVESGAWCCHACGSGGGPYDAAVALGKTPPDAMGLLEHFGLAERDNSRSTVAKEPAPVSVTERQVQGWHTDLMSNAAAIQRLRDLRGPVAEEALVRLEVGLDGDRLVFPYRDSAGELTGAVRYQPNPERRNGRPKTEANKGTRRQLVPPPETLEVAPDRCLFLVEGEPDALAGQSIGLPTVGVPGSGGWKVDWVARFAGKRVCLLPDADSAGRESADRIEADLQGVASTVQVVDLHPERDDGADLTDFLRDATADGNGSVERTLLLFDQMTEAPEPVQEDPPPNGGEILGELVDFIRRYVAMSPAQADVVALWIVHTHALDAADATPYLAVTSAEKRSGKSRLLEVMALLVARPLSTMNVSDAALFRSLTEPPPTVLFDEMDAVYGAKARDREDQRGMINAGYRRGASVLRCVGDGSKQRVEPFPVFAAKALAGIGELPDTVADRAIPIRLERRGPQEQVARFHPREVEPVAEALRATVTTFADESLDALKAARPTSQTS